MSDTNPPHRLVLSALDGSNPLGFLAALGVLAVLTEDDASLKLGWRAGARWTPYLESQYPIDEASAARSLARKLRGHPVAAAAESKREAAQECYDDAKKRLKKAGEALKKRKLPGKEREAARQTEIAPLVEKLSGARAEHLAALKEAVPSPELALGRRPDCTIEEYRNHARASVLELSPATRGPVDLLAAFGAEEAQSTEERIAPTPFCFITGSGHQWFLDTARELMALATEEKIREALFEPWAYRDEKYTMRWDPADDRRYALMDKDPTASGNKSATVWMANLLAYRALIFFPCATIDRRAHACATGWVNNRTLTCFTWPIWEQPVTALTLRSLLADPEFGDATISPARREELRDRGVAALFRSRRIQVGNPPLHKINFSPAAAV